MFYVYNYKNDSDTEGISFIGSKKDHPHEDYIIIRVAYKSEVGDINMIKKEFMNVAQICVKVFETINNNF